MKRLTLYLLRSLAITTLFVTASMTAVIWLTQSLRLIEIVIDGGAPFSLFLTLMVVALPTFLATVLPLGLLAAVVFTYNRLQADSELVVMRAAGLGPLALAKPALILAVVVTGLTYSLTLFIAPAANRELIALERLARSEYSTVFIREGVFNDMDVGLTIFVRERTPNGEMRGILIHDSRQPADPITVMAEHGVLVNGDAGTRLVVFNGTRQEVDPVTGRLSQLFFDRYAIDLRVLEPQYAPRWVEPRERTLEQLLHPNVNDVNDQSHLPQLWAEFNQRVSSPLYAISFTLIGVAALVSGEFNRRGQSRRITLTIVMVVLIQSLGLTVINAAAKKPQIVPLMYVVSAGPAAIGLVWLVMPWGRMGRRRPAAAG
ncbi:MAG: LPS export ABC transporter permease LptF [Azospirillaceae bacterium]|nr:LPS export ABC transporter permease LptF [Azospirillaceae bacterium]